MSIATVKKRVSAPKAKIEQVEIGGRVCISYLRGDAKKFRELSLEFEKNSRRARAALLTNPQ